mmetsp:Transcript_36533/g.76306  ORF Transcript_36533/g.76306 Transcript_36533/m.76306 type:complete len:215 (-) Transcript_36533:637-1281(-)
MGRLRNQTSHCCCRSHSRRRPCNSRRGGGHRRWVHCGSSKDHRRCRRRHRRCCRLHFERESPCDLRRRRRPPGRLGGIRRHIPRRREFGSRRRELRHRLLRAVPAPLRHPTQPPVGRPPSRRAPRQPLHHVHVRRRQRLDPAPSRRPRGQRGRAAGAAGLPGRRAAAARRGLLRPHAGRRRLRCTRGLDADRAGGRGRRNPCDGGGRCCGRRLA